MRLNVVILAILVFLLSACRSDENLVPNSNGTDRDVWLIDKDDIVNWDSERDNIQSIDSNVFNSLNGTFFAEDEMVFAYHHNGITKLYPVHVLGGHEISNDSIGDHYYSVTYCPITASALTWNREINGSINEFGVSGKLYRNNLVPYDRKTGSHWTQMGSKCVNGDFIGAEAKNHLLLETRLSTIKKAFPDALLLDHQHCVGGVCTDHKFTIADNEDPEEGEGSVLPPDAKYYGVVKDQSLLLFELGLFDEGLTLFESRFKGMNLLIVGSTDLHYYAAFQVSPDDLYHTYHAVQDEMPVVVGDSKGNSYDLFGNIVSGPDMGKRLHSPVAYLANTFAWDDMFTDIQIYKPD